MRKKTGVHVDENHIFLVRTPARLYEIVQKWWIVELFIHDEFYATCVQCQVHSPTLALSLSLSTSAFLHRVPRLFIFATTLLMKELKFGFDARANWTIPQARKWKIVSHASEHYFSFLNNYRNKYRKTFVPLAYTISQRNIFHLASFRPLFRLLMITKSQLGTYVDTQFLIFFHTEFFYIK